MDIRPPAPPPVAALPATLFGDQSAEDKYETLLRFQAASDEFYHQKLASCKSEDEYKILQRFQAKSDEFYCRKRESIFAQLTPGNSVHRPTWSPRTRRTLTSKTCVWGRPRFAPHRLLSDSALTLRATNQATGVLKQKTPAEPLISPAPPQAAIKKIARFLSPDKKSRRASPRTRFLTLNQEGCHPLMAGCRSWEKM